MPGLIRYPRRSSPHHPPHYLSTYRFAAVLTAVYSLALLVFWVFTRRQPALVVAWDWLPLTYLGVLLALLVLPLPLPVPPLPLALPLPLLGKENLYAGGAGGGGVAGAGRSRLRAVLRRIAVGGLAEARDGKFGDIILADVLTSYAKVFADLYVALCMFLRPDERGDGGATARPDRACGGTLAVPLVMAVPSLIRLRQCLIEYSRVRRRPATNSGGGSDGNGWGGQHLANAFKYATAFPVIIFAALQRNSAPAPSPDSPSSSSSSSSSSGAPPYFRAWVTACLVNSLYSFYWDVAKDWDLTLFDGPSHRSGPGHPFGLRRRLHVGPPALYYAVIAADLLLRCTWALKLSSRLAPYYADVEGGLFAVQLLEVLRRWVWIFFRVETEWIRNTTAASASAFAASTGSGLLGSLEDDGILLGDFQDGPDKYEDGD